MLSKISQRKINTMYIITYIRIKTMYVIGYIRNLKN